MLTCHGCQGSHYVSGHAQYEKMCKHTLRERDGDSDTERETETETQRERVKEIERE